MPTVSPLSDTGIVLVCAGLASVADACSGTCLHANIMLQPCLTTSRVGAYPRIVAC